MINGSCPVSFFCWVIFWQSPWYSFSGPQHHIFDSWNQELLICCSLYSKTAPELTWVKKAYTTHENMLNHRCNLYYEPLLFPNKCFSLEKKTSKILNGTIFLVLQGECLNNYSDLGRLGIWRSNLVWSKTHHLFIELLLGNTKTLETLVVVLEDNLHLDETRFEELLKWSLLFLTTIIMSPLCSSKKQFF